MAPNVEPARSSASMSDVEPLFLSEELEKKSAAVGVSKPVTFLDNIAPSLLTNNVSCSSTLGAIADPSMPPYDPVTNYLSPRPQFRCYKPNPRIAALLRKQKEMGPLEDDDDDDSMFYSFSVFDDEDEEESLLSNSISCSSPLDAIVDPSTPSYDPITNYSSPRPQFRCYKPNPRIAALLRKQKVDEEVSEEEEESLDFDRKIEKKFWGVSRSMCFSMVVLLMLMVACVSVTKPPEFGLIEDFSISDLGQFYRQSRVVAITTSNAKLIWSLVSKATNGLGEGGITPVTFKYVNLSDLQKGSSNDVVEGGDDDDDDDELDSEIGKFEEEEYVDGVFYSEEEYADGAYDSEDEQDDQVSEIDEIMPSNSSELDSEYREDTPCPEEIIPSNISALEIEEIVPANSFELDFKHTQSPKEIAPSSIVTAPQDQESEVVSENEVVPSENIDLSCDFDTALSEQEPGKIIQNSVIISNNIFAANYYVVGFSVFLGALSATVAVFMYHCKRIPVDKRMVYEIDNNKQKNHQEEKAAFSSQNLRTKVDEDASFTTAASSFLMSIHRTTTATSTTKETKTGKCYSERESMGSSSSEYTMGSPLYGTFTTLVKIPVKNANGKEEITTPVRRSSRIRSHGFTSP